MLTGKLKYVTIALLVIVMIIISVVIYRMYYKFKPSKVKDACTKIASIYGNSQPVYQLLMEGCQFILKSQDLSKQVEILAKADGVSLETALAMTSMNNLISAGMIQNLSAPESAPAETETPVTA